MARAGRDGAEALREALHRRCVEAACRAVEPDDIACAGVLYDAPDIKPDWTLRTRLMSAKWTMVGHDSLGSSAWTAFTLDGRTYASVGMFHETLKLAEDDPRRDELALGRWPRRGRVKPAQRGVFRYRGAEIAVDSVEHGVLIARATEAKVLAHASVRQALLASERRWLVIGEGVGALGRYMPFALMVMRTLLARR